MRTLVVAAMTVVVVALTGGCVGDVAPEGSADRQGAADDSPQDSQTPATPSPPSADGAVVDSETCAEVRAGIAAFNEGEYGETVQHFRAALPLAEERDDGSGSASELIEAVRYYAELDPELYPEAARSSPEFAKYKAITLGQCVAGDEESSEPPGVEA